MNFLNFETHTRGTLVVAVLGSRGAKIPVFLSRHPDEFQLLRIFSLFFYKLPGRRFKDYLLTCKIKIWAFFGGINGNGHAG